MIHCELDYCIYNKKGECILKNISISTLGNCEECIIPTICKDIIEKYKKENAFVTGTAQG